MRAGVALAAAASAGAFAYAIRSPRSQLFGPSLWHGNRARKTLALTFDDGPSESTPALLNLLARHHAKATFFQIGHHVRRLPGIAREVASAHEIGNHSDTHPYFHFRSPAFIYSEFSQAQRTFADLLQLEPRWFRSPYGIRWPGFRAMQSRLGLTGVMWTLMARDWKLPSARIADRVLAAAENGAIICLHDGRGLAARPDVSDTIEAVARLLPELASRGFAFETVSELLCPTTS